MSILAPLPVIDPSRCRACMMLQRLCICDLLPRIPSRAQLVLLIHHRELRKPTNTGSLAARCLPGSEIHVVGRLGHPVDYAAVTHPDAHNLFLFPGEPSELLTPEFAASLQGPVRLIVPDGNWGQAARMRRKLPPRSLVTNVTLPPGDATQYRLRYEADDRPEGLATLEAIARALAILSGPDVQEGLLSIFRIFVERTLWSRGKLPANEVHGGIPAGASAKSRSDIPAGV